MVATLGPCTRFGGVQHEPPHVSDLVCCFCSEAVLDFVFVFYDAFCVVVFAKVKLVRWQPTVKTTAISITGAIRDTTTSNLGKHRLKKTKTSLDLKQAVNCVNVFFPFFFALRKAPKIVQGVTRIKFYKVTHLYSNTADGIFLAL